MTEKQIRECNQSIENRLIDSYKFDESVLRDKEELIRLLQRENYELEGRIQNQSIKIVELADHIEILEQQIASQSINQSITSTLDQPANPPNNQSINQLIN